MDAYFDIKIFLLLRGHFLCLSVITLFFVIVFRKLKKIIIILLFMSLYAVLHTGKKRKSFISVSTDEANLHVHGQLSIHMLEFSKRYNIPFIKRWQFTFLFKVAITTSSCLCMFNDSLISKNLQWDIEIHLKPFPSHHRTRD